MERKSVKWKVIDLPKEFSSLQEEGFLALEEVDPTQSPFIIYGNAKPAGGFQKSVKRKKRKQDDHHKGEGREEVPSKKVKPSRTCPQKKKPMRVASIKNVESGNTSVNDYQNAVAEDDAASTNQVSKHAEGRLDVSVDASTVEESQTAKSPEDSATAEFDTLCGSYEMVPELIEGLPDWTDALGGDITVLHPAVTRVLLEQGFVHPTTVQRLSLLSAARDRKDVVACSQTGTGKTLAFGLPVVSSLAHQLVRRFEKWQERQQKVVQQALEQGLEASATQTKGEYLLEQFRPNAPAALVLEPTRELALQVFNQLKSLCAYTPIRCASVVGGLSPEKQLRVLGSTRPYIVVATPGRLLALVRQQTVQHQSSSTTASTTAGSNENTPCDVRASVAETSTHCVGGLSKRRERLEHEGAMFAANFSALQFLVLDEADRLLIQPRTKFAKRQKSKSTKSKARWAAPTETQELLQFIYHQLDNADISIPRSSVKLGIPALNSDGSVRLCRNTKAKYATSGKLRGRAASLQTFVLSATLAMALQRGRQGLRLLGSSGTGVGGEDHQKGRKMNEGKELDEDDCAAALLQHVRVRPKCLLAVNLLEKEQKSPDSMVDQHSGVLHENYEDQPQQTAYHNSSKLPPSLRLSVWKCPRDSDLVSFNGLLQLTYDGGDHQHGVNSGAHRLGLCAVCGHRLRKPTLHPLY